MELEELEVSATGDELAAEMAATKTTKVASFTQREAWEEARAQITIDGVPNC